MNSLLQELYTCCSIRNPAATPEQKAVSQEYSKMCDLIKEAYGIDFVDRFLELSEQTYDYNGTKNFNAGFRAGVQLMLEVFTPA